MFAIYRKTAPGVYVQGNKRFSDFKAASCYVVMNFKAKRTNYVIKRAQVQA